MDVLKDIMSQIRKVDKDIRTMEKSLSFADERDLRTINMMMSTLGKLRANRANLTDKYHSASQDINLRNREIEERINKIKAEIKLMSNDGDGMIYVREILNVISKQAEVDESG